MGLWDNLRTAYQLAARVERVERLVNDCTSEWADTLEILKTREERMRKRDQRAMKKLVNGSDCNDCGDGAAVAAAAADPKDQLRALARSRGLLRS